MINLLYSISREGVGILMTIHQPSWNIFKIFDKVYILSPIVQKCIYEGSPGGVISYLASKGLHSERGITPPDFITDVASGLIIDANLEDTSIVNPKDILHSMAKYQHEAFKRQDFNESDPTLNQSLSKESKNPMRTFWTLLFRCIKISNRDFSIFWCQVALSILMPFLFLFQVGGYRDNYEGCPISMEDIPNKMDTISYLTYMSNLSYEYTQMMYNRRFILLFTIVVTFLGVYIPIFYTQSELKIVWREVMNGSYDSHVYYGAKMVSDLSNLTIPGLTFSILTYSLLGGNFNQVWRPFLFIFSQYVSINLAYGFGVCIACILRHAPLSTTIFTGEFSIVPNILFTGFFTHIARSMDMCVILGLIGFLRHSFDMAFLAYYGFDSCGEDIRDRIIGIRSSIMLWLYESLAMIDLNGVSIFGSDMTYNTSDMSNITYSTISTVQSATKIFCHDATKYFIAADGETRAASISYQYDYIDSDLGRVIAIAFIHLVLYRIVSYFLLSRSIHERF